MAPLLVAFVLESVIYVCSTELHGISTVRSRQKRWLYTVKMRECMRFALLCTVQGVLCLA